MPSNAAPVVWDTKLVRWVQEFKARMGRNPALDELPANLPASKPSSSYAGVYQRPSSLAYAPRCCRFATATLLARAALMGTRAPFAFFVHSQLDSQHMAPILARKHAPLL